MPGWGVIPSIRVRDMRATLAFYTDQLEFSLDRGGEGETNASLSRGDGRLMIETAGDFYSASYNEAIKGRLGTPSATALYIEAQDLAGFHARLKAAGAVRIVDPLATRPWGQDEFTVEDPEGNWLTFWERLDHA
ncbi:MAG TPA: VOC family protein [Candidatus Limnocylindrales bacterium]|nr:VOC family protein [Candidatus Limnocylindrales bacterium]